MRRFLISAVFIIFICTILILQFFGGAIRTALSPKVEVVRPQIYAVGGRHIDRAVPMDTVYMDETGMAFLWLAVEDNSSGERCYIAKKEAVSPGDTLDGYMSVRSLGVTSLVIVTDPAQFSEGQRVEILQNHP
ncbi:MAG: hypothetical protein IJA67_00530 [Oscillospiraceae bacterium]|nr:hypothetical protein [Oscillospiraceae bacterium]